MNRNGCCIYSSEIVEKETILGGNETRLNFESSSENYNKESICDSIISLDYKNIDLLLGKKFVDDPMRIMEHLSSNMINSEYLKKILDNIDDVEKYINKSNLIFKFFINLHMDRSDEIGSFEINNKLDIFTKYNNLNISFPKKTGLSTNYKDSPDCIFDTIKIKIDSTLYPKFLKIGGNSINKKSLLRLLYKCKRDESLEFYEILVKYYVPKFEYDKETISIIRNRDLNELRKVSEQYYCEICYGKYSEDHSRINFTGCNERHSYHYNCIKSEFENYEEYFPTDEDTPEILFANYFSLCPFCDLKNKKEFNK